MADQTEQEPIDPWRVVARWHRDGDGCDDLGCAEDHWSYWSDIDVARAADAALLRERDAQIARKETALNMWRGWAHFVYLKGGPITLDDEALRAAVCVVHDDETATLRAERDDARAACMEWDRLHKRAIAERDAAQQQIATLTEALKELREDIESGAWAERNDASKWAERDLIWFISAALQSTRPQEQPAEPDYIDIEPDIRVVRVYRDGSWLEDLKAGGRRRASFPPATHQQGGHQP